MHPMITIFPLPPIQENRGSVEVQVKNGDRYLTPLLFSSLQQELQSYCTHIWSFRTSEGETFHLSIYTAQDEASHKTLTQKIMNTLKNSQLLNPQLL